MTIAPAKTTRQDLHDSVMMFAAMHGKPTFHARDFTAFAGIAALTLDEELANELMLELVVAGFLREIGPGVYAIAEAQVICPDAVPLWPEEGHP